MRCTHSNTYAIDNFPFIAVGTVFVACMTFIKQSTHISMPINWNFFSSSLSLIFFFFCCRFLLHSFLCHRHRHRCLRCYAFCVFLHGTRPTLSCLCYSHLSFFFFYLRCEIPCISSVAIPSIQFASATRPKLFCIKHNFLILRIHFRRPLIDIGCWNDELFRVDTRIDNNKQNKAFRRHAASIL